VLVSLTRITIEEYWIPQLYNDSARPLLAACEQAETDIWRIAATVLKPEQQKELRGAISAWSESHPDLRTALYTRALGLATEMAKASQETPSQSGSVFSLLKLDPLSGLDPATRELAQTRLLAERALYLGQRMPPLLRDETELLALNFVGISEVKQLLTNSAQLSASVERVTRVTEQLPGQVSAERKEILDALEAQQGKMGSLVGQTRDALTAGKEMSLSLNTTLTTFDGLMKRFGVGEPKPEQGPKTNARPFNVLDYAKTANELAGAAQQLDAVLRSFNGTLESPGWRQRLTDFKGLSDHAQENATSVLNHAFWLAAGLIVLAFGCALLVKLLVAKMSGTKRPSG